jgi:hypothetical protein
MNINKMECQYCKKLFTTTSSLGRHKRTAKKCISSRNEKYTSKYKCDKCDKLCRDYTELTKHLSTCKAVNVNEINVRYESKIDILNTRVLQLEQIVRDQQCKIDEQENILSDNVTTITELTAKIELYKEFSTSYKTGATSNTNNSNNTTNNTVNNIIVSSLDIMEDPLKLNRLIEKHYSTDYFIEGQIGVAKFSNDHLITDDSGNKMYVCTDASRNSFKYKNAKGEIVKDPNSTKFAGNLLDNGLKDMARKHSNTLLARDHDFTNVTSKFFEIDDMCKDTKKFCKHLGGLVSV